MLSVGFYSLGNGALSSRWLRDAVAIAVEALSWMELEGLSERQALTKTTRQLGIENVDSMRTAFLMIMETTRALNLIDRITTVFLAKNFLEDLDLGKRNFLRIFIWWALLRQSSRRSSIDLLEAARHVLGWRQLLDLELTFGNIMNFDTRRFLQHMEDMERIALSTFNREWFVAYCYRTFGREFALDYLRGTRSAPPNYLRINAPKDAQQSLLEEIESEGVKIVPVEELDGLFRVIQTRKPLTLTRAYKTGLFSIQDKSSYLSTTVSNPKKHETILDLCAAPGGKTAHLALHTQNSSKICSIDISRRRFEVWKREMKRCKISCATPIVVDARQNLPVKQIFDLVIVDPPCTNSGAFGKTPSLKWRLTSDALEKFTKIQWQIICSAIQAVKPGGRLIYSTCSVTVEENEMQIERLLRLNPEFSLEKQIPFIGQAGLRNLDYCQRLYPHLDGCNGYFVASLTRKY